MTIKINARDITPNWIHRLIKANRNATFEIKVHASDASKNMSEDFFWETIALFDWKKGKDTDAILAPSLTYLKTFSNEDIFKFQEILAEKLYQLDTRVLAENLGSNRYQKGEYFSSDSFLYARASVVANGLEFYETVLKNPHKMPKEFTFEALLYLAQRAFEEKNEKEEWTYLTEKSYETYSNSEGWNGKNWKDNLKI